MTSLFMESPTTGISLSMESTSTGTSSNHADLTLLVIDKHEDLDIRGINHGISSHEDLTIGGMTNHKLLPNRLIIFRDYQPFIAYLKSKHILYGKNTSFIFLKQQFLRITIISPDKRPTIKLIAGKGDRFMPLTRVIGC